MLNITGEIKDKNKPAPPTYTWEQIQTNPGVYKSVYPPRDVEQYKDVRFVSIGERVIYVKHNGEISLISLDSGWGKDGERFELLNASVKVTVTEK